MSEVKEYSYIEYLKDFVVLSDLAISYSDNFESKRIIKEFSIKIQQTVFSNNDSDSSDVIEFIKDIKTIDDINASSHLIEIPDKLKGLIVNKIKTILEKLHVKLILDASPINDLEYVAKNMKDFKFNTDKELEILENDIRKYINKDKEAFAAAMNLHKSAQNTSMKYFLDKVRPEVSKDTYDILNESIKSLYVISESFEIDKISYLNNIPSKIAEYIEGIAENNAEAIQFFDENISDFFEDNNDKITKNLGYSINIKRDLFNFLFLKIKEFIDLKMFNQLSSFIIVLNELKKDPEINNLSESFNSIMKNIEKDSIVFKTKTNIASTLS